MYFYTLPGVGFGRLCEDRWAVWGLFNLGLAAVVCEMLYKVDPLAVDKDISLVSLILHGN